MIVILKEFYTISIESKKIIIINELLNQAIYVNTKQNVSLSTIEHFCYKGITEKKSSILEKQIVLMLFQKHPEIFYHSVDNQLVEFVNNLRNMILVLKKFHNFTSNQLLSYIKNFKKKRIVIGTSIPHKISQKLIDIGINNIIYYRDLKKN